MPRRQSTTRAGPVRRSRAPRIPLLVALPVALALPALVRHAQGGVRSAFVGTSAPHDLAGGLARQQRGATARRVSPEEERRLRRLQEYDDRTQEFTTPGSPKVKRTYQAPPPRTQAPQPAATPSAPAATPSAPAAGGLSHLRPMGAPAATPSAPAARPSAPAAGGLGGAAEQSRQSILQAYDDRTQQFTSPGAAPVKRSYQAPPPPTQAAPAASARPAAPVAAAPPMAAPVAPAAAPTKGTVAAEYMVSDAMIEDFYQKTVSGGGGLPPKGIIMDLVIKHFLGSFDAKTKSFTRTSTYKGPPPQLPGKKDLPPAMELLKEQMKSPAFVTKGGPALDETEKVENDGKGWVWLAADMTPGGLALSLFTAVPYGKRPLLVAKQGDVDSMFAKVNWDVVLQRFEETMGGPQIKQR